jgi:hypothetical protein
MKYLLTICVLFLLACEPAANVLTAERARAALADRVHANYQDVLNARHRLETDDSPDAEDAARIAHHAVFVSPGRAERAEDIRNARIYENSRDDVIIGNFIVNLDARTYQLVHNYSDGEGWFEDWVWSGTFSQDTDGNWIADDPKFVKFWGSEMPAE